MKTRRITKTCTCKGSKSDKMSLKDHKLNLEQHADDNTNRLLLEKGTGINNPNSAQNNNNSNQKPE